MEIRIEGYEPLESESYFIEYWYNRHTRDWVIQVFDNNDIQQESHYIPNKSSRDHEIEYLKSKYNTTDIRKV